ncbi:MAG: transposase [Verrucomicrobiae bacterium]|nr:transposase [Verrucomicrobiae bacterium]
MNRLRQFWQYTTKVFHLPARLRAIRDRRSQPEIPTRVFSASLLLGAVLRTASLLQLQAHTQRRGWRHLVRWPQTVSDDAFGYVLERYRSEDWRAVEIKDATGQPHRVTEYYHRQVYAQIQGPDFSVILDVEPIRPGADEAAAAVRLLGRLRRLYGPRFFNVVSVDAWYVTGPFLRAVRKLGWGVVSVLKQERSEIYQETTGLSREQTPQTLAVDGRQVALREVQELRFGEVGPVRVVLAEERWTQRRQQGGRYTREERQSQWRWVATPELDGYAAEVIWAMGHRRWGVENHAFNELTQHYHLTHCPRHEPVAILAWLLILVLGFNLFELFVRLHGKRWRAGRETLAEEARQLDRALEAWQEFQPLWSG